jgi:hypothetical protein
VLRAKHEIADRPFAAPLFPLLPGLFVFAALMMLWSAVGYVTSTDWRIGAGVSFAVMGSGVVAMLILERWAKRAQSTTAAQ